MLLLLLSLCALLGCAYSQCEEGWRPYEDKCYYFSADVKKWDEARLDCEGRGSHLMSIQDNYERLWLRTQIGSEIFWIGLNDIASEDVWEWSDGSPYHPYLAHWSPGQPDNYLDDEDCGQVVGSDYGQWNDENCVVPRKFICKRGNPNPPTMCDTANGWRQHESNCYKLKADVRKSWLAARFDCVTEGADLVSITSASEEQYITGRLDPSNYDLWIGFSTLKCTTASCQVDPSNTQFAWSDASSPTGYLNWGTGQPEMSDVQTGVCSAIIKEAGQDYGKWKSHVCRYERPYMCKRGLNTICPRGWQSFGGNCYWMVSNINLLTNWYEAQTRCADLGANLMTIKSQDEQFFLNSRLPDFHQTDVPDVWIGVSDKDLDGSFQWVDKTPITIPNWSPGFPRNTANLWDCGQIFTGNYEGKWETTNCFKNLGYICKMAGGQNVKPTSAPEFHCDPGYLLLGDHCYHFETERVMNWQDAENYCSNQNGHLASFQNQEELSFLIAHMPGSAWVGLNDITTEGHYVWTDGSPADFLPWGPKQPDNWQGNEDCIHIRPPNQVAPGLLNDDFCTSTHEFICRKGKGEGPPPQPPTSGPGWNEKCGSWMADPFNDFCYLFNFLSPRTWTEARTDCLNQGGDLVSITEPFEQAFIQGQVQLIPTGVSVWMGGHDSITEGGWEWTDGSPFRYVHWAAGNPDNFLGEDCLTMYVNGGQWNDDNCEHKRGYVCKRRGNLPPPPPPHDGFETAIICEGTASVLHCPEESVINIQSAFLGRRSDKICPHEQGATGTCTVDGVLPMVRKSCDNKPYCFLFARADPDPCPSISKYFEVVYSCEQKVCLHGLGVEDGLVPDSELTASSSTSSHDATNARLRSSSCWMPSAPVNSWIQVNLGPVRKVTGIILQGCPQNDHWVTKFRVQHSMDGTSWTNYESDGGEFPGSMDRNTPETQLLGTPVSAKFVRILPLDYNNQVGLRFDVLGCTPDYAVTCSDKPNFNFASDRKTVHCPAACATKPYNVYGSEIYRGDSNICAAAIHAGVVLNENGGECTLLKAPGQNFYPGSTRNGITTRQFTGSYAVSYQFADGELRCSGSDWYEFGDFCYKPFMDKKTWFQSQAACRSQEADLVSILSMKEQSWLESYLYMATSDVWTGLTDLTFSGLFSWSDDHTVTFTHWAPGEPNNHNGFSEDCVEMLYQTGRWNDVACTELNTYICKKPKAHYPLPSAVPTVYGCPQGWNAYGYSCYWMEETSKSWSDARAFCEQQESKLLHIGDIYEQSHFTVELSGYTGLWWIGLRAKGGSGGGVDYIWDNGAPLTFTHWDKNQPDNQQGTCVGMTTGPVGGFWDDKECAEEHSFVCEKPRPDITPPTRPPTPPPSQGCATGWTAEAHFRNCYKLFTNVDFSQKKSWGAARDDCLSRGADLVSIHNQEEENFLSVYTKGTSKWIGLKHNPTDGGYHWSDATPVSHTNWGSGEPNNHEGREDCVEMVSSTNGTYSWWNDLNCDAHQDWICMITKGKNPVLPPKPPPTLPSPDCGTNPGWRKSNGICYYYNDTDIVDFHTAMHRCYQEKARLASILNKDEQAFINTMVGTGRISAAWIGLRVFGNTEGEYMWMDGSPVTYVHWGPGEPNDANGEEQCVQMNRHQGSWNDANCGRASAGYVCKKLPGDDHTPAPPTQPWTGNCPEGWMLFRNKCFLFEGHKDEVRANWSFARSWCKDKGGDLAVIDDRYENDFVSSYLRDLRFSSWIGMSDLLLENQFAWSDGSPVLYTNWNLNEPNNAGGAEHCAAMTHNYLETGRWNDDACSEKKSFVCYRKKSSSIAPPPTKNPCKDGYVSWYKNCYKLVEEPKTWDDAQAACKKEGGNLASIDMSYDQNFVSGVILQGKADAWIGLRRKDDGDSYSWSDGWPVFFTHWGPGEPSNYKGEGCVSMHGSFHFHGTWNDTACDSARPYICKISSEAPPPTPTPGDGKCLPGWWAYGRYCYFVYNEALGFSWPESRHYCQLAKGDLVSIHSRAESEFIRSLNHSKVHNLWIGLTRDANYGWSWTDRTSLAFLNWAPGEPNDAFHPGEVGAENCGELYPDGHWNDNNCVQKRGFVCRHRQYYTTDDGGNIVIPTDAPGIDHGGVVAGALIGALVVFTLILGLIYYMFSVRGVKLSTISLPTRTTKNIDVPAFNNPNFGGESES